jgi:hypothetical protein
MDFAMVSAAERDRELVADLAAERTALGEAKVMGVAGCAAANQAGLLRDVFDMLAVTYAARLGESQNALVDAVLLAPLGICAPSRNGRCPFAYGARP